MQGFWSVWLCIHAEQLVVVDMINAEAVGQGRNPEELKPRENQQV